jgi:hypothetical protein
MKGWGGPLFLGERVGGRGSPLNFEPARPMTAAFYIALTTDTDVDGKTLAHFSLSSLFLSLFSVYIFSLSLSLSLSLFYLSLFSLSLCTLLSA